MTGRSDGPRWHGCAAGRRSLPRTRPHAARAAARAPPARQRQVAKGVQTPLTEPQSGGKRGGTLTVLDHEDFEHLDPGQAYFALDYEVIDVTQRPLYSNKPNTLERADPGHGLGSAGNLRRRQDDHGPHPPRRPLQPAGQPRSHLGRRRLRDRARRQPECRKPLLSLLLRLAGGRRKGERRSVPRHHHAEHVTRSSST